MPLGARELLLIIRARDEATRTVNSLARSMKGLDKDTRKAISDQAARGQALSSAGVAVAGVGVAMAGALADMTKAAVDYERQSALTFTQVDKVKGSVKDIEAIGKRVALAIPAPFEQMQTSLYDIFSSMDVNMGQAEVLLRDFAKASVAGQVDLQEAARGTIGIMNAYRMKAGDVTKVNDVMFQLVRKGVGTYGEFARTIGRAVPSAVRAGQSIEDLAGMMAFLTRNGVSAAMASASAGRALDAISNPKTIAHFADLGVKIVDAEGNFRPMVDIMQDLGKALKDMPPADKAATLQELFKGSGGTIQARRFFDIAVKNYPQLISLTNDMKKSTGAMGKAYSTMKDTGAAALQDLSNNWEVLKVELGSALVPVLKTVVGWFKSLMGWWTSLGDDQKKIVGVVLAIAAGLTILAGIVMVVVGGLGIMAAGAAALGIALGPLIAGIVLVVAAVIGIVAWFKNFWKAGGPIVDLLKTLFKWVGQTLADAWNDLVDAVQPILPLLKFVGAIIGGILVVAIVALAAALKAVAWVLKWVIKILAWLVDAIVNGAVKAWNTLYAIVETIVKGVVHFFQWLYDTLIGHSIIPDLINGIVGWFKKAWNWLADIWNSIKKTAITVWNAVKDFFVNTTMAIVKRVVWFISNVKLKWMQFWATIKGLWNAGIAGIKFIWNSFLNGLRVIWDRFAKPVIDKVKSWIDNIKHAFQTAKDNIVKIWNSIKEPLKAPINFMLRIYNDGIANTANKLASFVGIKQVLPRIGYFKAGGVLPGYTPGRDVMAAPMAAFSGGEAIMRPEFTRGVGKGWVDRLNWIAKQSGVAGVRKWMSQMGGEGMAFANGGVMPGFVAQNFDLGGILEKVGKFVQGVKDFTITNVKKSAMALFNKILGGGTPGGGIIKDLMTRIPMWMRDVLAKWIGSRFDFGGTKGAGPAANFARAQQGKPYVWGGVGPAGYDCSGFMSAIWNVIHGKNPYSRVFTTHGFTGANKGPGDFVRNLRSGFMVGVTNAGVGHMAGTLLNRINVESRGSRGVIVGTAARGFNDSLFPMQYGLRIADKGGYLTPGLNMILNKTGTRERILDPSETRGYETGGRPSQNFYIYTHEINPRKNAADLGWMLETRSAP